MKKDPDEMLQRVLALIDDDISRIRTKLAKQQVESPEVASLDPDTAWTLCRYGDLLNRSLRAEATVDERKQKKLKDLSTEELRAKAEELLGKK